MCCCYYYYHFYCYWCYNILYWTIAMNSCHSPNIIVAVAVLSLLLLLLSVPCCDLQSSVVSDHVIRMEGAWHVNQPTLEFNPYYRLDATNHNLICSIISTAMHAMPHYDLVCISTILCHSFTSRRHIQWFLAFSTSST